MLDHLIFITYLLIFLLSNIGYGYLFATFFSNDLRKLNFGYLGILGLFFVILISISSSFLYLTTIFIMGYYTLLD